MKIVKGMAITLLLSTGSLCAMDQQKELLFKRRDAAVQERDRLDTLSMRGAPSAVLMARGRAEQAQREEIRRINAELEKLETLQTEYDKKIAEYDRQIAVVQAEQGKLGDMAKYDKSLATMLSSLKTQRDEAKAAFEWNKANFGKSPEELQKMNLERERMALEKERLEHLEAIKGLDEHLLSSGLDMRGVSMIREEKGPHIQRLEVINAALLGINVERK